MAYQIIGKIEMIGEVLTRPSNNGGQPFQSREFVLDATRFNPETGEPWENHPKFELSSRNVNILDGFQVGQRVVVDFVVRGVKYQDKTTGETKYFSTISAFRVTAADQHQQVQYSSQSQPTFQQPAQQVATQSNPQPAQHEDAQAVQMQDYDLPF
jgi:hypothetical protein